MVIGERFAWVHMPKTGGDATHAMFAAVPGLVRFSDPLDSNDKHLGFWAREEDVAGKLLVMNIRRLPAWSLSAGHHKAIVGVHPEFEPLPLASAEEMADSTEADDMLRWLTGGEDFTVDRWLRTECLEEDVLELLGELDALTPQARERVRSIGRVSEQAYERDLARRFTSAQIRRMYERNPGWAEVERKAYGALLGGLEG
jgi:hypothetical protein